MKALVTRLGAIVLAFGFLTVGAYADYYYDTVGTGFGSSYSSSTFYDIPVGATVEYEATCNGGFTDAGTSFSGCGLSVYQDAQAGYYDDTQPTTEAGDLSYQIWATDDDSPYANSYIAVYW